MRWHNGRSRRSRNLHSENASKGSETKKDEGAAHSIQARRSLLQQRPDTFAQTNSVFLIFRLQTAADHTFRIAGNTSSRARTCMGSILFPAPTRFRRVRSDA